MEKLGGCYSVSQEVVNDNPIKFVIVLLLFPTVQPLDLLNNPIHSENLFIHFLNLISYFLELIFNFIDSVLQFHYFLIFLFQLRFEVLELAVYFCKSLGYAGISHWSLDWEFLIFLGQSDGFGKDIFSALFFRQFLDLLNLLFKFRVILNKVLDVFNVDISESKFIFELVLLPGGKRFYSPFEYILRLVLFRLLQQALCPIEEIEWIARAQLHCVFKITFSLVISLKGFIGQSSVVEGFGAGWIQFDSFGVVIDGLVEFG